MKIILCIVLMSLAAAVKAATPPLPEQSRWESRMDTYGDSWGATILNQSVEQNIGVSGGDDCYYDGAYVHWSVSQYLGQPKHAEYAAKCWADYKAWARTNAIRGYDKWARGAKQLGSEDISILYTRPAQFRDTSAYVGQYCGTCTNVKRELAYSINTLVQRERAGEARQVGELAQMVEWAGAIMWQNHSGEYIDHGRSNEVNQHYQHLFMTGLMWHALIELIHWEEENNRDVNLLWADPTPDERWPTLEIALLDQIDFLYEGAVHREGPRSSSLEGEPLWDAATRRFTYTDTNVSGEAGPNYTADLNLLIAPAYAWAYKRTYDEFFLNAHDEIFAGAMAVGVYSGKHYNQQYFWSIDGIDWRNNSVFIDKVSIYPRNTELQRGVLLKIEGELGFPRWARVCPEATGNPRERDCQAYRFLAHWSIETKGWLYLDEAPRWPLETSFLYIGNDYTENKHPFVLGDAVQTQPR